ncbi:putative PEP-binding protein [Denitromonas sp.]|uniref:putative PEP-binding protein n=1 Tax=Denitromonas sp. TaxID=2734609 RepID=UPI002AFF43CD|nr:putative PEP-binding protein [Denitromonas sp.]
MTADHMSPMQDPLSTTFERVARGQLSPEEGLKRINRKGLSTCFHASFDMARTNCRPRLTGEGIMDGDVSGVLVLSRALAQQISEYNATADVEIPYIYCIDEGDIDDFGHIKQAAGFMTGNPGKTTFSPVQAVQEGVPTVIGLSIRVEETDEAPLSEIAYPGIDPLPCPAAPRRVVRMAGGMETVFHEGDLVSISGSSGEIFDGVHPTRHPIISGLFSMLTKCYIEARSLFGARDAWENITRTPSYQANWTRICEIVMSEFFIGFQMIKNVAQSRAPFDVLVNVHNLECVVWARLVASRLYIADGDLVIETDESRMGIGLLRDERMWIKAGDIDLLRMMLLGPNAFPANEFAHITARYIEHHANSLYEIFSVGTGKVCVARTLCMPYSKFLPDNFDVHAFCQRNELLEAPVSRAFRAIAGEREVYHGCRGIRLFSLREDLASAWLTALLMAAKRTLDEGIHLSLRVLLATLTFAEEAAFFGRLIDDLAPRILGARSKEVIQGLSTMLETGGAYIDLESILSTRCQTVETNGALIGTNDFTTACLNLNRGDAPRNIIPGYIEKGLLSASPFMELHPTVGKAMIGALQRSSALGNQLGRNYYWGLAGELSYSWDSVAWLADHAAPIGLNYISTSPETMLLCLFASTSRAGERITRAVSPAQ